MSDRKEYVRQWNATPEAKTKRAAYMQQLKASRKAAGLCIVCGEEAGGKRHCQLHSADMIRRHRVWREGGIRAVLGILLANIRAHIKRNSNRPPHDKYDYDLDTDYVCDLWTKQSGRCAISGIKMTCLTDDLRCVSIDRIDSTRGHVRGNTQLICRAWNLAKGKHTDSDLLALLEDFHQLRSEQSK